MSTPEEKAAKLRAMLKKLPDSPEKGSREEAIRNKVLGKLEALSGEGVGSLGAGPTGPKVDKVPPPVVAEVDEEELSRESGGFNPNDDKYLSEAERKVEPEEAPPELDMGEQIQQKPAEELSPFFQGAMDMFAGGTLGGLAGNLGAGIHGAPTTQGIGIAAERGISGRTKGEMPESPKDPGALVAAGLGAQQGASAFSADEIAPLLAGVPGQLNQLRQQITRSGPQHRMGVNPRAARREGPTQPPVYAAGSREADMRQSMRRDLSEAQEHQLGPFIGGAVLGSAPMTAATRQPASAPFRAASQVGVRGAAPRTVGALGETGIEAGTGAVQGLLPNMMSNEGSLLERLEELPEDVAMDLVLGGAGEAGIQGLKGIGRAAKGAIPGSAEFEAGGGSFQPLRGAVPSPEMKAAGIKATPTKFGPSSFRDGAQVVAAEVADALGDAAQKRLDDTYSWVSTHKQRAYETPNGQQAFPLDTLQVELEKVLDGLNTIKGEAIVGSEGWWKEGRKLLDSFEESSVPEPGTAAELAGKDYTSTPRYKEYDAETFDKMMKNLREVVNASEKGADFGKLPGLPSQLRDVLRTMKKFRAKHWSGLADVHETASGRIAEVKNMMRLLNLDESISKLDLHPQGSEEYSAAVKRMEALADETAGDAMMEVDPLPGSHPIMTETKNKLVQLVERYRGGDPGATTAMNDLLAEDADGWLRKYDAAVAWEMIKKPKGAVTGTVGASGQPRVVAGGFLPAAQKRVLAPMGNIPGASMAGPTAGLRPGPAISTTRRAEEK